MATVNLTTSENQGSSEQKLTDARDLIAELFHTTDLEFVRVELWQFLKAVTTEKPFSFFGRSIDGALFAKAYTKDH